MTGFLTRVFLKDKSRDRGAGRVGSGRSWACRTNYRVRGGETAVSVLVDVIRALSEQNPWRRSNPEN